MNPTNIKQAINHFLQEDIGAGDITSESIFPPSQTAEAVFIAKGHFVVAGLKNVAMEVFAAQNKEILCLAEKKDGEKAVPGDIIFHARGPVLDLLKAERVALNLVQRLCGIATQTKKYVDAVKPLPVKIVDTRKTTPGLRVLEKYAVTVGGGYNHRFNLADGVLIKDNHLVACGSIAEAVEKVRSKIPHTFKIEVETESIAQVEECLACGVEIIMLDNMDCKTMRQAVQLVNKRALVEASGGVSLDTARQIAETGVDLISIGALTHSVAASDISMRLE